MLETIMMLLQILAAGALAGLIGYMKQESLPPSWKAVFSKEFWEKFDPVKALKTVFISLIIALIAYVFNMDIVTATIQLEYIGLMTAITIFADQAVKVIVRRTPLVKVWNWVKEQLGFA